MTAIQREPVITAAFLVALVQALIVLLQVFGITAMSNEQIAAIMAIVTLVAGVVARAYVTPVSDPRDNAGNPLTPKGQ